MSRLPHLVSFLLPKTASQPDLATAVCLFVGLYGNLRVFSSWARFTPASEYNREQAPEHLEIPLCIHV